MLLTGKVELDCCSCCWLCGWVMAAAAAMLRPKKTNAARRAANSIQQRKSKWMNKQQLNLNGVEEWKLKKLNEFNWNESIHEFNWLFVNGSPSSPAARQAHQLSLLFALPLREAKKKIRVEWKRAPWNENKSNQLCWFVGGSIRCSLSLISLIN